MALGGGVANACAVVAYCYVVEVHACARGAAQTYTYVSGDVGCKGVFFPVGIFDVGIADFAPVCAVVGAYLDCNIAIGLIGAPFLGPKLMMPAPPFLASAISTAHNLSLALP